MLRKRGSSCPLIYLFDPFSNPFQPRTTHVTAMESVAHLWHSGPLDNLLHIPDPQVFRKQQYPGYRVPIGSSGIPKSRRYSLLRYLARAKSAGRLQ